MIPSNGFNWKHKLYVQFATLAKEAVPVSSDGRKKKSTVMEKQQQRKPSSLLTKSLTRVTHWLISSSRGTAREELISETDSDQ